MASSRRGNQRCLKKHWFLQSPLMLREQGGQHVQAVVREEEDGLREVSIYSQHAGASAEAEWTLHASGTSMQAARRNLRFRLPSHQAPLAWCHRSPSPTAANMATGLLGVGWAIQGLSLGEADLCSATALLASGGIPNQHKLEHLRHRQHHRYRACPVQVTIGGIAYVFDPSFKTYAYTARLNLANAIGYSQSTLLNAAENATITANSITKIYNSSNQLILSLDGTSQRTGSAGTAGGSQTLTISITHPWSVA